MEKNNNSDEPIVLGTLRKEKSSKPIFVFIVLAIVIGVTFALPYLENYLNNPNTFLGEIYNNIFGTLQEDDGGEVIDIDNSLHILNNNVTINYRAIIINNINIDSKTINYDIKVRSNSLDLDEGNYYLEIYGSVNNLLERIKLIGTLTPNEEKRSFTFKDLKFNPSTNYYGKIIELKEEDYPEKTLNSDESGIASLTCTDTINKYEYLFDNYKLKNIKHTFEYNETSQIDVYLNMYQKYLSFTELMNNLKSDSSKTEETNNGFIFTANIDLNTINKSDLKEADNSYYYKIDKLAKIIDYDMKVQGFTCK